MNPKLWHIHQGDVIEVLSRWPDSFVQCVVTSPPYWGLRDYGEEGQGGLEETPEGHVEWIVAVMREVRRVLRDDGAVWINEGDCYASGGRGTSDAHREKMGVNTAAAQALGAKSAPPGLKPKDLVGMPWRVAFGLQADGWYLRSEIIWAKPNPMPESVTDRPTKSHETVFLLTKQPRYFYDADAVREEGAGAATTKMPDGWDTGPGAHGAIRRAGREKGAKTRGHSRPHEGFDSKWDAMSKAEQQSGGRNLRDVWGIATYPFPGAHFATFPEKLVEPCIKAGTSEKGACRVCGVPWERVVEAKQFGKAASEIKSNSAHQAGPLAGSRQAYREAGMEGPPPRITLGWKPACLCGQETGTSPRPCVVLDPFAGSGTVGVVAGKLGRDFIGIDLAGGDKDMGGHTANQRIEAARRGVTAPLRELSVALEQTELFTPTSPAP